MAATSLKPTTRTIQILINAIQYNDVLDTVSARSDAPELEETVFSTENSGGTYTMGTERLTLGFGGPLSEGSASSVPFLPLASYQGKSYTLTFSGSTTHTISGTLNMQSAGPDARAGGAARSAATAKSTGAITVSWPTT